MMSTTSLTLAAEAVCPRAENIRQSAKIEPTFLKVGQPESFVRRSPWVMPTAPTSLSIGSSLLGHVVVLAILGYVPQAAALWWVPVQPGRAAIELQASLATTAAEGEPDPQVECELLPESDVHPRDRKPVQEEAALVDASVEPLVYPMANGELPPIEIASVPFSVYAVLYAAPATMDRVSRHAATPDPADRPDDAVSRPVRTAVGRRHAVELASDATATLSSPASQASEGAESDLPTVVYNPAPQYPAEALMARRTGRVVLRVKVAADGTVLEASIYRSSGVASLDEAALRAVRTWRFSAAESSSAPARELGVPVNFVIRDA